MTDPRDEINRIIETAERNAYARGWQDAVAAITAAAEKAKSPTVASQLPLFDPAQKVESKAKKIVPRRTGRPSSSASVVVKECIAATPGMKGVEVINAVRSVDSSIKDRTVRTCLRRLRLNDTIYKRNGVWYPKQRTENGNGEAVGSPPH